MEGNQTSADDMELVNRIDRFSGVLIKAEKLPDGVEEFERKLDYSLNKWEENSCRGVWLEIPQEKAQFIPLAVQRGFDFHHAKPGYVQMTKWLPKDRPSKLPNFATHYVGVGGLVINDNSEVLLIQEQRSIAEGLWKIPGGLAEIGESLGETAMREVFEETGIETEFVSLLSLREKHNYYFGHSDLYFVALLKPKTLEITPCPTEIKAAKWTTLEEFYTSPFVYGVNGMLAKVVKSARKLQQDDEIMKDPDNLKKIFEGIGWTPEDYILNLGGRESTHKFYSSDVLQRYRNLDPNL
eukprot:CAMPEP_0115012986 /NCGR_PEP_ID=MMETSP0216-20121206/25102_1 /TAXON_ID=223996 /ORGANISM="Protocruzia adherens, Strain Boccale" /LENGTH=295 /DNA_ID=CAMNT_0002382225 /DNA_START=46 /DNA_END=933 /DNA_ORIENTATION=-